MKALRGGLTLLPDYIGSIPICYQPTELHMHYHHKYKNDHTMASIDGYKTCKKDG